MGFNATTVWEVRTTGSTSNAGAFDPGVASPGTDFSQQDAAQVAYTDLVIDGTTNTKVTSSAHPFSSTSPGNFINVTGGTGFTVQRVEILSVTGSTATVDKSLGTLGSTGGTGNLGGAHSDPALVAGLMVGGNTMYVKNGTYTITSASTNVAGGCLSPAAGTTAAPTQIIGYSSSRVPGNTGTRPLLQASGISTFSIVLVVASGDYHVENMAADGASLTSSRGFNGTTNATSVSRFYRCKASNCTNSGFVIGTSSTAILCEATGCATGAAFIGGMLFGCVAHDNTITGFSLGTNSNVAVCCISSNNSGSASDGFFLNAASVDLVECLTYNNGRDGFRISAFAGQNSLVNCIAENNGQSSGTGSGFNADAADGNIYLFNCGGYNNKTALVGTNIAAAQRIGLITATAEIFYNAAGNDFRLNTNVNGGNMFRAKGIPDSTTLTGFPGISTPNYVDVGAPQHRDPPHVGAL